MHTLSAHLGRLRGSSWCCYHLAALVRIWGSGQAPGGILKHPQKCGNGLERFDTRSRTEFRGYPNFDVGGSGTGPDVDIPYSG